MVERIQPLPKLPTLPKPAGWSSFAFFEKIQYYGRRLTDAHARFVDKLEAKRIVEEMCGGAVKTARVVRVLSSPSDVHEDDVNPDHLVKGAHGCKFNVDLATVRSIPRIQRLLASFNKCFNPLGGERQYTFLSPRFFIEEKINCFHTGRSGQATVYMVRCIYGNPVSIGIIHRGKMNNYYLDWRPIHLEIPAEVPIPREDVERMIESARLLSAPFEFVRVDFYLDVDHTIYFSEFTLTPSAGRPVYSLPVELELGKTW